MLPFSLGFCLLGLFSLGDVSRGGGGGGGGGATLSLVGEIVSSNQRPRIGSLSSSGKDAQISTYIPWVEGIKSALAKNYMTFVVWQWGIKG